MKGSPFVRYAGALIAGIVLYEQLPNWPQFPQVALFLGICLLGWGMYQQAGKRVKPIQIASGVGGLLMLVALGWAITYQHTAINQPTNIVHLADTLRAYEGVITAQPEERAKTFRVELAIRRGNWSNRWQPLSGRIIVYVDKANEASIR